MRRCCLNNTIGIPFQVTCKDSLKAYNTQIIFILQIVLQEFELNLYIVFKSIYPCFRAHRKELLLYDLVPVRFACIISMAKHPINKNQQNITKKNSLATGDGFENLLAVLNDPHIASKGSVSWRLC